MDTPSSIPSLMWRYATKRYDTSKKLSPQQLQLIKDALRFSPSSFGLQAYKFIHITDPELRKKLSAAAWNQPQVTEASDFFVLASYKSIDAQYVDHFVDEIAKTRGISADVLKGYRDTMVGAATGRTPEQLETWLSRQVYIPLGMALTVAAENKIDASPMEGFNPQQFDEILGLDKMNLASRVMLAVGFRSPEDATQNDKKVRFSESELFIEK